MFLEIILECIENVVFRGVYQQHTF